jgi:hypothetical protein
MMNPKKVRSRFLQHCVTATLPFCLVGCMGVYEGGFECPPGKGVGCKSISEVNELINKGTLPKKENLEDSDCECQDSKTKNDDLSKMEEPADEKIWIAPWAFKESF